jgi:KDO2-lipid IV(A) lauroyltransferase
MRALPFGARRELGAFVVARIMSPIVGHRRRIRDNLAHVMPDLPKDEVDRLLREVPANIGRTIAELYSPEEIRERVKDEPFQGPGVAALTQARDAGRGALIVTGHIGNYDALRAALITRGFPVGGLYKPMRNPFFNDHYVRTISKVGTPLFPRDRRGMAEMVRFLRQGGMVGMVIDQHTGLGEPLTFMGQTAKTGLSAADMALRYDALLITGYAIRREDGGFTLWIGNSVPHTDNVTMTQALNDDLEVLVRQHMDQWLWTHRRWKGAGRPA